MSFLIAVVTSLAILANAVVYVTDVFGAIVQRPAVAAVDDRTPTQMLGHVHQIADRRFPVIGAVGLIGALATTVLTFPAGDKVAGAAGAIATLALVAFLVVYTRISKPVNTALTAAAIADRVPEDARQLQAWGDSVINARFALQTIALVALCVGRASVRARTPLPWMPPRLAPRID